MNGARITLLLDHVTRLAAGDLGSRMPLSPLNDDLDGIASALNMLGEELSASFVSNASLQGLFDALGEAVLVVDAGRLVLSGNRAARRLLGRSADELVGERLGALIESTDEAIAGALSTGPWPPLVEARGLGSLVSEAGATPAALTLSPVPGASYAVVLARDLSALTALENKLQEEQRKAREAAEASSRAKSRFLVNMSHEMRTPLTAIVGLAETLLTRAHELGLPGEAEEDLRRLHLSGQHLATLIGNVLDLSKIEAGKQELRLAPTDLRALFRGIEAVYGDAAARKGVRFSARLGALPAEAAVDEGKLRQIVINIVANSIKFTEAGRAVTMAVFWAEGELLVEVHDEGCGIAADSIDRVFDPFEQADQGRRVEGTGLGLAITRNLVWLHQGSISLDSEPGRGTSVVVRVPAPETPALAGGRPPLAAGRFASRRVLIIDDSALNGTVVQRYLRRLGIQAEHCASPRDGLARLLEAPPDLLLLDLHMPDLDGYELCRQVRLHLHDLPIIAFTADAFTEVRDLALGAGMNDFLSKPIELPRLIAVLERFL